MTLSRWVATPAEAEALLAGPGQAGQPGGSNGAHGPLVLAAASPDPRFAALGFVPLVPDDRAGELVRPLELTLAGPAQTHALGRRLAEQLRPGDLVVLSGPLGAGKTALTQGIGAGLGVQGAVTSPTFVLARRHRGPVPLVHVDAYRLLDSPYGIDDLDLEAELLDGPDAAVVVVEWGAGLVEDLAPDRLEVALARGGATGRTALIRPVGTRWSAAPRTQLGNITAR